MLATPDFFGRAGNAQWPYFAPGVSAGLLCTMIKTTGEPGDIVMAAVDDADPLLDTGAGVGPRSPLTVVEKPATQATYGLGGLFGVWNPEAATIIDGEAPVISYGQVKAKVFVPIAGLPTLTPLIVDFTNARLITAVGVATSEKVVALLCVAQSDNGGAAIERNVEVWFSGTTGFGTSS